MPELLLLLHAERAVVGRHDGQLVHPQALPEVARGGARASCAAASSTPTWRPRSRAAPAGPRATGRGTAGTSRRTRCCPAWRAAATSSSASRRRHVHDVQRHVAGDLGQQDGPVGGLALELGGPGERVELGIGLAAGQRLGDEHVDGDAVLGVHHDHRAGLAGRSASPAGSGRRRVEDARVGHEQLEAGDALVVDEVRHRLQRLLVDAADDLVEAVVDGAVAVGLVVPRGQAVLHVARRCSARRSRRWW